MMRAFASLLPADREGNHESHRLRRECLRERLSKRAWKAQRELPNLARRIARRPPRGLARVNEITSTI